MTDTTTPTADRSRALRGVNLLGPVAVAFAVVGFSAWVSMLDRSPGWSGPVFALATAAAVVAILVLTGTWSERRAWVGVVGLALVAVGSGLGRPREEVYTGSVGSQDGSGEVSARLDTWWVLVGIGLVVALVALIWSRRGPRSVRGPGTVAAGSFLAMSLGYVAVAVLMKDLVVGQWVSGRPIRRCRGTVGSPSRERRGDCVGELWLDAAVDEAEAATAFAELAGRLGAIGAPAALVARCRAAARDEERHARVCRELAARQGARWPDIGPHPDGARCAPREHQFLFSRRAEVVRLAVESFVDGVVGEGFAARRLVAGASTASEPNGASIRSLAVDEARHATLGADIVRWSLAESHFLVDAALRSAAGCLPDRVEPPMAQGRFRSPDVQRAGLVDADRARELWVAQKTEALEWLDEVLAAPRSDGRLQEHSHRAS